MPISRIYQPTSLSIAEKVALTATASHHLINVLRVKLGDEVTLFNGKGGEYLAVVKHIAKKIVEVEPISFLARDVESPLQICLAQGIARGEKMDFIVQKAVELGVAQIVPLVTERCNVRLDKDREEKRLQHWQAVAISACEQSGRNLLPEIVAPLSLSEWLKKRETVPGFVLAPQLAAKLSSYSLEHLKRIDLLIGPEGGLCDKEIQSALEASFLALNLGPRILRTETATIAALTVVQYQYGDFS